MYKKAVKFQDFYLAPASEGMKLYEEKKFAELKEHLKQLDQNEKILIANVK